MITGGNDECVGGVSSLNCKEDHREEGPTYWRLRLGMTPIRIDCRGSGTVANLVICTEATGNNWGI